MRDIDTGNRLWNKELRRSSRLELGWNHRAEAEVEFQGGSTPMDQT